MDQRSQLAQAVEITIATYDAVAEDYATRNESIPAHWSERMAQFVALLGEQGGTVHPRSLPQEEVTLETFVPLAPVLDAGCGHGRDARALAGHGLPVLAVDLSQGMLDAARERTARRLPRGEILYTVMDLRHLELPDACCRGVWCSASLLHLPRHVVPRAVGELARVAQSGAPVAVFVKRRREEHPDQFLPYSGDEFPGLRRYFSYYTPEEARALLQGAGLRLRDVALVPDARHPDAAGWVSLLAEKP